MFDIDLTGADLVSSTFGTPPMNRSIQCISNDSLKQMIINHLLQTYSIRMNCTNKYFRLFDFETDLETLKKYKHLAYANTNQNINLIVLVKFKGQPKCLYIDKIKNAIYLLDTRFSTSLYDGTIFEGEMIETKKGNYFIISDFLVYMKKDLSQIKLDHRLSLLKSIIDSDYYQYDPTLDYFEIISKDFVEYSQIKSFMKDYVPTLPYNSKISGLIFRPLGPSNKNLIFNFPKGKDHDYVKHADRNIHNRDQNIPMTHVDHNIPIADHNIHVVDRNILIADRNIPIIDHVKKVNDIQPNSLSEQVKHISRNAKIDYKEYIKPVSQVKPVSHVKPVKPVENVIKRDFTNAKINTSLYKEVKFLLFESGNPDDYILKLKLPDGQLLQYGYALSNDMKTSQYIQNYLEEMSTQDKKNGVCVMCSYNSVFGEWKPVKIVPKELPDDLANLL